MGYFYIDDSIHDRGAFIICAVVYSKVDLTQRVFEAIRAVHLRPGTDEFKSGAHMQSAPEQKKLRDLLWRLLEHVKVGLVVVPLSQRGQLGNEVLKGIRKFIDANGLSAQSHEIVLDQGIECDKAAVQEIEKHDEPTLLVRADQDSRLVGGIQVADLAAHSLGIMLLEQLGLTKKKVSAGADSGYEADLQLDIGFEMWAMLRHSFFMATVPTVPSYPGDPVGNLVFDVEQHGLHISNLASDVLRAAAVERFATCYRGCIH